MSLSSLRSRLAFFLESNSALRTLPLFSSQGPTRKKQRGKGSQHLEMSELTPAVPLGTSLSPHREFSPVLFTSLDQHPSAAASDLVSYGGGDDGETACHWWLQMRRSGRVRTTTLLPCILPSPGMDADLFRILSNAVEELDLEWSPPEEPSCSCLDEWLLPGRHQAPRQQTSAIE